VHRLTDEYRTHRNGSIGQALRRRQQVRNDAKVVGSEWLPQTPEAGNYFVENEQNTVVRAKLAKSFEIAPRWNEYAGRASDGLDDDGSDRFRTMEGDKPLKIIGEFRTKLGLPLRKGIAGQIARVAKVIDPRQSSGECAPVVD